MNHCSLKMGDLVQIYLWKSYIPAQVIFRFPGKADDAVRDQSILSRYPYHGTIEAKDLVEVIVLM
jgi:hypothetical protein